MFCDISTLMNSSDLRNLLSGNVDGMEITQEFLLGFEILIKISILVILLSRILLYKPNRIIQIIAGLLLILVQGSVLLLIK